jgi:hypothetical protein
MHGRSAEGSREIPAEAPGEFPGDHDRGSLGVIDEVTESGSTELPTEALTKITSELLSELHGNCR